jgi:phosphoethanolamine N-methyltransferase
VDRAKTVYRFWKQFEPSIRSMLLNGKGEEIDPEERKEMVGYFPDLTKKTVLELAAGIGRYTGYFASHAEHVTTVDFMEQFVEENKRANGGCSNVDFLCEDAMDLEFEDERFDFIFINWLFMYLGDEEVQVLSQRLSRWLKPGGCLFFRESCAARTFLPSSHDPATYRTLHFYTQLFQDKLKFIREDSMKVSIETFANPFQCFWIFIKD